MENIENINHTNKSVKVSYDYFGIFLSFLCGVHCIVTPLLILYMPVIGDKVENVWFHSGMILLVVFAFYRSIYKHFKEHRSKPILALGVLGIILFCISYVSEFVHHSGEHDHGHTLSDIHGDETYMIYVAITGAFFLITAHILNIRKCRCFKGKGTCSGSH